MPRLLLLAYLFFLLPMAAQSQPYSFRHISQSDGLLNTQVRSVLQDDKGYIWILFPNGLQRYDGSRFVSYRYELNNGKGIINTQLGELFLDKKQSILFISYRGNLQKLNLSNQQFQSCYNENSPIVKTKNFKEYIDEKARRWFINDSGIFRQANGQNLVAEFFGLPGFSSNKNNFFITDAVQKQTWLVLYNGLLLFDEKTGKVYSHQYNPIHHPLLEAKPWSNLSGIMKDREQNIWLSTGRPEFYKYHTATKKLSTYSLNEINKQKLLRLNQDAVMNVSCFFEDDHHNIWIGTSNAGLLLYNKQKDSFTQFVNDPNNQQGLHYNYTIGNLFQDREENLWVSTDKGINIFNPYRQYFSSVHHQEGNQASLPKNEIQGFIQSPNGDILAGTWGGGLTLYDSSWNFKKNIYFANPYEYNMTWCFVQADNGDIWVGCQHGFIHVYHPATQSITTIHPSETENYTVRCMTKDAAGNIWLGLHNGKIIEWREKDKRFYKYNDSLPGINQQFSSVNGIFFDKQERCWVSTDASLKRFDTEKRIYTSVYLPDQRNPASLTAAPGSLEQMNDTTLAITTHFGGLNFFNTTTQKFRHLSINEGAPSSSFYSIKKEASNALWLTTEYDLYKYKPTEKKFIRYAMERGLINSAFISTGFYVLKNGQWLTSTSTEMVRFYPERLAPENSTERKVEITGFKIFDSTANVDSLLAKGKTLQLSYKQNFLTIEFSLLSFLSLQQTNYYYRLSGVDNDWVDAGGQNFASYTNLSPGDYTFSVKADNGSYTIPETSFKIQIRPPFYLAWWFKLAVTVVLFSILYFVIRNRIRSIRNKADMRHRIAEAEMTALRSQMNPHFIFNCLSAIDNMIETDQKEKATTYLNRFARLIRNVLDSSKKSVVPLQADVETLNLYMELERFRCDDKFSYTLTADPQLLQGDYKVPPLVVQPFVENAIHHGLLNKVTGGGRLHITISAEANKIVYCIEDNGVGRLAAAALKSGAGNTHTSHGMAITEDRIVMFNEGEIAKPVVITDLYSNEKSTGTRVQVFLRAD